MNTNTIRKQFPVLSRKINGHPLIYFDTAATALKPKNVIDATVEYYKKYSANTHRGIHTLSEEATQKVETAREKIAKFIHAGPKEIIFTSGMTDGLNLLAYSLTKNLKAGDRILLSEMEHHSNIVPWQQMAKDKKLKIDYIPLTQDGRLDLMACKKLLSKKPKIFSLIFVSNTTGTINPVAKLIKIAKQKKAITIIDAAQAVAHLTINVKKLNCDFMVFSAHKMFGPTGVGVVYGKTEVLNALPPFKTGGNTIEKVTKEKSVFTKAPARFEAGTLPAAQIIGFGAAVDFINKVGLTKIQKNDRELIGYFLEMIKIIPQVKLLGTKTSKNRLGIFSFSIKNVPPHDVATLMDNKGIAVRSGHHCTQLLHKNYNIPASTRVSLSIYNTTKEIDKFIKRLKEVIEIFNA
ncbi:MAG: cysteine desulfurase CsdA [Candidatus Doudnabacteria bacterium CG10_big_fil_rev_8_21_14_0_10_41_10]|uniref:Cysteine desulfurase n=1 Tax=Candidatus Doudnabacteria bacterium CG10_big_fil_rev_8_21_14_0_10_41_10 TaxID=1974551 RepID=A0A2H0VDA1_9BACT|nr:MAG: cysteine desulfurase CsdA [Candidatus Doudnabacteria bacterium CG10_big_fil_rev_8_21_14_0_10_41_10]